MRSSDKWAFRRGVVRDKTTAYISSQPSDEELQQGVFTQVLRWRLNAWGHFDVPWEVIAMGYVDVPEPCVVSLGAYGDVHIARQTGFASEVIDFGDNGPAARGNLRDLRIIGDYAYAAGMARQVYRKRVQYVGDAALPWERADAGLLADLDDDNVRGLTSIDGPHPHEIYACGWGGEIWWYDGKQWRSIESPTNLKLERIFCGPDDRMVAVGQNGVIIEGRRQTWSQVSNEITREQFWGGCLFQGRPLLATQRGVYELTLFDRQVRLVTLHGDPVSSGWLCCNDDVVWSIGSEHLFWSSDASTWNQVFAS
jgi:hypothetical protein